MTLSRPTRHSAQSGFTLLEMLISLALLLVITGAIFGGMSTMQKNYRGNEIRSILNQQMRATMEMMAQEIGQAGLAPSGMQLSSIYTASNASGSVATVTQSVTTPDPTNPQSLSIQTSPAASAQTGQLVIADSGAAAEVVTIKDISTDHIKAIFQKTHTAPFNIYPHGLYPQGITFQTTPTVTAQPTSLSNTSLIMFGAITGTVDTNGAGTLSIVEYKCPTATSAGTVTDSSGVQWGPLIRYRYDYSDATGTFTLNGSGNVLDLVRVASSAAIADGCRFDYSIYAPPSTVNCPSYYFVTSVNITLVAKSTYNDPQSNGSVSAPVVITKSFMNIQPRNIVNAYNLYSYNYGINPLANDLCSEFLMQSVQMQTQIGNLP